MVRLCSLPLVHILFLAHNFSFSLKKYPQETVKGDSKRSNREERTLTLKSESSSPPAAQQPSHPACHRPGGPGGAWWGSLDPEVLTRDKTHYKRPPGTGIWFQGSGGTCAGVRAQVVSLAPPRKRKKERSTIEDAARRAGCQSRRLAHR